MLKMYLPVDHHHPRNSSAVVLPPMALLLPPFVHYDLVRVDLVLAPQITTPVLIEEDGLENVLAQRGRLATLGPTSRFLALGTTRWDSLKLLKSMTSKFWLILTYLWLVIG